MTNNEAFYLIDSVLDALIEVGNGITEERLHEECDNLFKFRDLWLKQAITKLENIDRYAKNTKSNTQESDAI